MDSRPPRPSDNKPPKPSDMKSKLGKGALFKDRREHRIELRQKITKLKEQINALKAIETEDQAKKVEIEKAISELRIRLKECDMEKDAIENFNHTQFLQNVKDSDQGKDRFSNEEKGNTRFFEHLTNPPIPKDDELKQKEEKPIGDPLLESPNGVVDSAIEEDSQPESPAPKPPLQLPPNTIV